MSCWSPSRGWLPVEANLRVLAKGLFSIQVCCHNCNIPLGLCITCTRELVNSSVIPTLTIQTEYESNQHRYPAHCYNLGGLLYVELHPRVRRDH